MAKDKFPDRKEEPSGRRDIAFVAPKEQDGESREARANRERISREQEAHLGATAERGFLLGFNGKMKEAGEIRSKLQGETSIRTLRNGGVNLRENDENYLEKFERLAAAFLTPAASTLNKEGHLEYHVDFHGNELAEWNIGAGHCLPPSVTSIRVFDESGAELFHDSERGIKDGRVGYYEKSTGAYISIHTGYRIEILSTADAQHDAAVQKQIVLERDFFERNEQKATMTQAFHKFFAEKGWKVRIDENDFYENIAQYLGPLDAKWWQEYKRTGVLNESLLQTQLTQVFSAEEQVLLGNLGKMGVVIDLERLPMLLNDEKLAFLHEKDFVSSEAIRLEFQTRGLSGRLTPDGFLIPEGIRERTTVDRAYWANLLGDNREEIEPRLTKVEFLGRTFKVNRYVTPYLLEAGKRLANAGIQYRAETGGGYSFRRTWGRPAETDTTVEQLSLHSWGVAIDINPGQNPPHEGGSTNISPEMVRIMRECGFAWGGNWKGDQYDPMHFQFMANPFEYTHAIRSDSALAAAQESGILQKQAVA
ncbi:M15 family metallopeptidase [Candidatus Peregrinibacteria bacterium]|nr:M15 family metallopeptidase [Candidatus Peregrinibacteria bacterium]